MDEYSRVFAEYVVDLRYEDLSTEVIEKTKMHFLDTLGNILGAHEMPWSRMVIDVVKQMKGEPQSTVVGEGRYPMMTAALANGTMAHGIDADDSGARPSWAHPGSCVVPAAYAAAEAERVDGRRLITTLLAGYEVGLPRRLRGVPRPQGQGVPRHRRRRNHRRLRRSRQDTGARRGADGERLRPGGHPGGRPRRVAVLRRHE